MGTKVHSKGYLPGYYSMRDLNDDSSSSSWSLCYGDKAMTNGQYFNGFMPRTIMDGYPGYGKDALKQKMLEHEAVFKNQVYELHRLYRIQRDMMEEFKMKELHRVQTSMEPSSSSSLRGSQMPSEDAQKWHMAGFPLLNSGYERTSISGVEIVNSHMSCTKGNNTQPGPFPFQNGSSLKDSEQLDSRPLKVRKKLFDLELPADEYIDTEEGKRSPECKMSDVSSYAPNGNLKSAPESQKLFLVGHEGLKTDCRIAASASASCSRNSVRLADLNEPIEIEEAVAPASTDLLGHSSINGGTGGVYPPTKPNAGYLGVNEEKMHRRDGFLINSSIESKVNERGWLSHIYEAGSSKSNLNSVTHGLQQDKMPISSHLHDYPPGIYATAHSKDLWREGNLHGPESSDRNRDHSNNRHLEPHVASQALGSDAFFSSSNFSGSWAHSVSSWAKPSSSYTQKIITLDSRLNSAVAMNRGLPTSSECRETSGGKWQVGNSSRLNPGFGGDPTMRNGFYHGSASGSKEVKAHLPLAGTDYLNCSRGDILASNFSTNHGFGHFPKGSCQADSKPAIDINLNEVVSKSLSNEAVMRQDLNTADEKGKPEDHLSALPWLKNKPAHSSTGQLSCKAETVTDLNQPFTPKVILASSERKMEISENQNVKKILGFPIFETGAVKIEPSSNVSTSASVGCPPDGNNADKERKNRIIDINLECEPEEPMAAEEQTVEKEKQTQGASVRDYIDLNSCVTDCEDTLAPSYESKTANVKVILEIDLESPALLEKEDANTPSKEDMVGAVSLQSSENKNESPQDEVLQNAAETILSITSSSPKTHMDEIILHSLEASLAESLIWFVDSVSNELKSTSGDKTTVKDGSPKDFSEEMDDFEAITLQIPETKEEDYMPTPFIPEVQKVEDIGTNTLAVRPRRGQSRRGRQRRDFQRDILPGLATLSRHEVTEDLQTFGGLMRATGHHWISGLTRRNGTRTGSGRGRRRAVVEAVSTANQSPVCAPLMQQLSSIEAGLEDRSLTGWGKTTRRPRRQRCPAGSPPAVVIT